MVRSIMNFREIEKIHYQSPVVDPVDIWVKCSKFWLVNTTTSEFASPVLKGAVSMIKIAPKLKFSFIMSDLFVFRLG